MKSRTLHLLIALSCIGLLAFALYLQLEKNMQPCPWCILQRYAFIALAVFCLVSAIGNAPKLGAITGLFASLAGGGMAIRHMWLQAHPSVSCGIDVLENNLNILVTANWWPTMFKADGMCSAGYPDILGLSIPQWSLTWFTLFTLVLLVILFRRR